MLTLITDCLPAYRDACKKEFWTMKKETRTEHVNAIKLSGNMSNNKMERFNGEIRDREKTMRGLKGKIPAEACGIQVKGENRWLTLI